MALLKKIYRTLHWKNNLLGFVMAVSTVFVSTYLLVTSTYAKMRLEPNDILRLQNIIRHQDRPMSSGAGKGSVRELFTQVVQRKYNKLSSSISIHSGKKDQPALTNVNLEAETQKASTFQHKTTVPVSEKPTRGHKTADASAKPRPDCEDYRISPKHPIDREPISCVGHKPSNEACRFAKELYYRDDALKTCGYSRKVEICRLSKSIKDRKKYLHRCSFDDCVTYNRSDVTLWAAVRRGESVTKQGVFHDAVALQAAVSIHAKASSKQGTNFLFLECTDGNTKRPAYDAISQLLILSPYELHVPKQTSGKISAADDKHINVNIVLVDSAARAHFYRSLPTVIKTFNDINEKHPAEVFDYELFQSIEGHTAENLHALFTGKLFPKLWTGADRESVPVGAGELFNTFARAGYHTFYQDDLCYADWWGIRMDMGSSRSWDEFVKQLDKSGIDHAGLTFASCRILNHNNVSNPFAGPDGPLCFNGRFQDAYYLDFASSRHHFASRRKVPLLSFTALNVAHDHTGRRFQSIDYEMAKFVKHVSTAKNTITILIADHGNTYARYTHAIMEGRFEQFHPTFFLILPDHVKNILGKEVVQNLRQNQKKLITMLDIHDAVVNIPTQVKPRGIFGTIPGNRTCDDLDLRLPNLCVCDGWDAETLNDSRQVGVASFAVGSLNNKILNYQKKIREGGEIPNCQRLVPTSFSNIRERNHGGVLVTSLDFHTTAGRGAEQEEDIFHVEIQSSIDPKLTSFHMQLLNFDRVSKYGPYRACGDENIDMRLCVCDMTSKQKRRTIPMETFIFNELSPIESLLAPSNVEIEHKFKVSTCLYFRTISIPELSEVNSIFSKSYEVANICNEPLVLHAKVALDNMKTSNENPFDVHVAAYGVTYIGEVIRNVPYWNSIVETTEYSIFPPTIYDKSIKSK